MLQAIYYLEKKNPRKDGTLPLKVRVYRAANDFFVVGLKIYLHPHQFHRDKVVDRPDAVTLSARLDYYRAGVLRVLLDFDMEGTATMRELRERVRTVLGKGSERPGSFIECFEKYIPTLRTKSTADIFRNTLAKIRRFDAADRSFPDITPIWLRAFERYCLDTGMSTNGVASYMRNIRTVFNRAIDDGVAQPNDYPFRRFRIKVEQTRKRALTVDQLRALRDYPCSESQARHRDIFMLIFYLRGINVVDLAGLTAIENGYVNYRRSKTGALLRVKVEPEAARLIDRYRGCDHLLAFADRYANHTHFIGLVNRSLKSLGAFPGLSTYWARHSWASVAAGLDIPKETIAAGLGHSSKSVTDIYIAFDNRKVDAANRQVLDAIL